MLLRFPLVLLALATVGAAACGGGDDAPPDDGTYDCTVEDRDDDFVAGLEKPGEKGSLVFRIETSMPAPPSRGDNAWLIGVAGTDGAPVAGATVTVSPFMPDHRHGSSLKPVLTEEGSGRYKATPINLWMPGLWEITVEAKPAGGAADRAVFRFCIAS